MWPTCRRSKTPFAKTIFRSARRCSSRTAWRPSRERIFSRVSMDLVRRGCFAAEDGFEFCAGDGGSATLHDYDAARIIRQMGRFKVGGTGGDGERDHCDDGAPRARYVDRRVRAVNWNVACALTSACAILEDGHAVFAACYD